VPIVLQVRLLAHPVRLLALYVPWELILPLVLLCVPIVPQECTNPRKERLLVSPVLLVSSLSRDLRAVLIVVLVNTVVMLAVARALLVPPEPSQAQVATPVAFVWLGNSL
jgi:hypothetical protein